MTKTISHTIVSFALALISVLAVFAFVPLPQLADASFEFDFNYNFSCDLRAEYELIPTGGTAVLYWESEGYETVKINGQEVSPVSGGSISFENQTINTTYRLEATHSNGSTCTQQVTVVCEPLPVPITCEDNVTFTADPNPLPYGQSDVTLTWTTTNVDSLSINGVSSTNLSDSETVSVTEETTFTLTAQGEGGPIYCPITVTVEPPTPDPISCEDNVMFTATPDTLDHPGGDVFLEWSTTEVTSLRITDEAQNTISNELTGSETVAVSEDATYTLSAERAGESIHCPVTIDVLPPVTEKTATIVADKIVCEDEADLPNMAFVADTIGANTAADWVASHPGCALEPGWEFQWAPRSATNPGDTLVGTAGAPWSTFGPTDASGRTSTVVTIGNDLRSVWVREVLQSGYIPFTHADTGSDVSAEMYCHTDGANYDNYDRIDEMTDEGTYYCVAWNVAEETTPDPITCEDNITFTASDTDLSVDGGDVTFTWTTTDVTGVSFDTLLTKTDLNGSETVTITDDVTVNLIAEGEGGPVQCPITITVDDPTPDPFTCDDVTFTSSASEVDRGEDVTLTWSTPSDVDSVSIDQGIGDVAASDSRIVDIDTDITYTLTAIRGSETAQCPVSIDVDSGGGGGGGGSSSPRCELTVSDRDINAGDEITIEWDTRNATEVTLYDDRDNILFTTDDFLNKDKKDFFDYSITVSPTRDTEYTLVAERGSRDVDCEVNVRVDGDEDEVVVFSDRGQVAGIALSNVPYTGFEAGTVVTFLFYSLLAVWGLFLAYIFVLRRNTLLGFVLPGGQPHNSNTPDLSVEAVDSVSEESPAASYVAQVAPAMQPMAASQAHATAVAPANLPTGIATQGAPTPVVGYAAYTQQQVSMPTATEASEPVVPSAPAAPETNESIVKSLEDAAHTKHALLSSDAINHLLNECRPGTDRTQYLAQVIDLAKASYPTEDGWVVVNAERMQHLCARVETDTSSASVSSTPAPEAAGEAAAAVFETPAGTGSLAEAIVTGNIAAAYQMIGNRPMIALAEAAADLDAVFRLEQGEQAVVSELLETEARERTNEQLRAAIAALTGALDGTYSNEAEAVKMAILKAVKALN